MAVLANACTSFDRPEEEEDLKKFFSTHELPYAKTAVARMLEDVHRRVLFRSRNEAAIKTWIAKQTAKPEAVSEAEK